jgi:pimeloyl-ACP methyl ester carboxylesterase
VITSATHTIQGYNIHHIEAGTGTPVVLLHGFAGSCNEWRETVAFLSQHGYRAIAVDALGFGESDKPHDAPYSLPLFAKIYDDLLDVLGIESAVFVGHSFGGKCALAMTILHPHRVNRLVIADSEGFIPIPLFMKKAGVIPFLGEVFLWLSRNPRLFRMQLAGTFADPNLIPLELEEHFRSLLGDRQRSGALLQLSRCYDDHDLIRTGLRKRLNEVTCPTLVVWGAQDRIFAPKCGHNAEREIPNSQLVLIPRSGHYPHIERPRAFRGVLLGFLAAGEGKNR